MLPCLVCFFFFNDTATTEIYTLSLHDALPISPSLTIIVPVYNEEECLLRFCDAMDPFLEQSPMPTQVLFVNDGSRDNSLDRKSTRLNSSHANISYAVFCLKKKKKNKNHYNTQC